MPMRILLAIVVAGVLSLSARGQLASHEQIMQPPVELKAGLYPANANARGDIKAAIAKAAKEHKRVILDFGADWCLDCHILDNTFHNNPDVSPLLEKNYIVVHIDI